MDSNELIAGLGADRSVGGALAELRVRARTASTPVEAAVAHFAVGLVLEEQRGDWLGAASAYEAAVQADGQNLDALSALRRVNESLGRLESMAQWLGAEVLAAASEPARAARLLVQLGDVRWDLGDVAAAGVHYEQAAALDAGVGSDSGLERLEDIRALADVDARASVLEAAAAASDGAEARGLWVRVARVVRAVDPGRAEGALIQALHADPAAETVSVLLDRVQAGLGRSGASLVHEDAALSEVSVAQRGELEERLGLRALHRRGDRERAVALLTRAASAGRARASEALAAMHGGSKVEAEGNNGSTVEAAPVAPARPLPDPAKIAALDEQIGKFEAQKRWADVVKTLAQKAELLAFDSERIAVFERIAQVHVERTNNVAEAIKAFEAVLELSPGHGGAREFLKSRYEQRRDWEKLLALLQREASEASEAQQLEHWLAIARLATEKIRRPELSLELWEQVLRRDESSMEALAQLSGLYERAKDYRKLGAVLREQAAQTADSAARMQLLVKLGTTAVEKLNDDELAVEAWRGVLALDPNDRRAQEALKKRFIAMQAWDELDAFYAESGRWDELIRLLERESEQPGASDATKVALFFKIARLWAERKEKTDRAARYFERVLELDPNNRAAASALIPILAAANDARKLAAAYEVKLAGDPTAERVETLRALGALYEGKLQDRALAFERFAAAFEADPHDDRAALDLERTAEAADRLGDAAALIDRVASSTPDRADGVALTLRVGHLYASRLGRVDDAIARFRSVLEIEPEHGEALSALAELLRASGRWEDLHAVLQRRLERAVEPDERREVLLALGALREGELGAPERAVEIYQSMFAEFGDEPETLRRLDALYARLGRWEELVDVLARELIALGDDERAALDAKYRLGQTLHQRLGRTLEALDHWREILSLDPEHEGARSALESLLLESDHRAEAAQVLEPIYELRGDWESLVRVLEVMLLDAATPAARAAFLRKVGDVCEGPIESAERSFEAYGRALLEDPSDVAVREALEAKATATGAWARFAALLRQVSSGAVAPEVQRAVSLKLAEVEDVRLSNVDAAVEAYRQALASQAEDAEAREGLEALLRRSERWAALLDSFREKVQLTTDPATQERILADVAAVQDGKLADSEAAIATFREVLAIDPTSARALGALDELFERLSRWNDLADNLQTRLDLASDPSEQSQLMLRIAALRESRMGQTDVAIEAYREILQRDGTHTEALAALERLVQDPAHTATVSEILENVYRDRGAYEQLIGVYEIQVRLATDAGRRVALLHRVAELQETALDDPGAAFKTLARALGEDPSSEETLAGLERLARAHEAFSELAAAYEERAGLVEDPAVRIALYQRAATVHEDLLQNAEGAIGHYRSILALDPRNLTAVDALERLYQLGEKYDELAKVYLVKASLLESADDAKAYLFRASEIYETVLDRQAEAVGVYQRVLEVDREDLPAVDALIRLYVGQGAWAELLEVQQRKIDLVSDPDEKKRLYFEVGTVFETELSDISKAIDAYNKVLELDPSDLIALQRLDPLYLAQKNWQELLSVLERASDLSTDRDEACAYRFRVAEIHEKQLGDVARAVDIYRGILDENSEHAPTLAALEGILRGPKEAMAAAQVLEPVYTASGAFAPLVGVLEVQLAHTEDLGDRVSMSHRIAEIHEQALDQSRAAFDALLRALPWDVSNELTLSGLERLADSVQGWPEVAAAYDAQLPNLEGNVSSFVELGLRTARTYEVQLGDVEGAIARYRSVLNVDGQCGEAAKALDRLYEAGENWQELAAITRVAIALPDASPAEVIALKFRLAQVNEGPLGDLDAALVAYREVLDIEPDHAPTIAALEAMFARSVKQVEVAAILRSIYEGEGEWAKLANLNEQALALESDPAARLASMLALAELHEGQLVDGPGALNLYLRAVREAPRDERAISEAERLAGLLGAWPEVAECYADAVEASGDDGVKQSLGRRLGRIYEEELQDLENAEAAYNFVASVAPLDAIALERLDVIYSGNGNAERLAQVLDRRVNAVEDPGLKVEILLRHGQILESELAQPEEAAEKFRAIIDRFDPRHVEALDALDRLYSQLERSELLYQVLETKLDATSDDAERAELGTRLASLAAGPLNRPEDAVRRLNEVLALRGEDADSLEVLATLHENAGKTEELIDTLERQLIAADDYDRKALIGLRIARTHEQARGDLERAIEAYRRVLDIDSGNDAAFSALESVYRRSQNHDELLAVLQQHIAACVSTLGADRQRSIWVELAGLYLSVYQQPADAAQCWRQVLDVVPQDEEAIEQLIQLHSGQGQWREVADVLALRVQAQSIDEAKIPILIEIAGVWEDRIAEPEGARSAYEQILEIDALHDRAFERLEALHTAAGRWEPLAELYLGRNDALDASEVKERVSLLRRIALVYEDRLRENEQAYDAILIAYEEDVTDKETVAILERVAASGSRWNTLLQTANEWWKSASEPRWTHIGLNLAKWYGVDLGKPEWALPIYQQVLARQPDNLLALHSMTALYRKLQQWPQLTQLLERCMAVARTDEDRRKIHVDMGEVLELHLNQVDAAVEHYRTALNLGAQDVSALSALERVYEGRGNVAGLVDVLQRKADALASQGAVEPSNVARLKLADVLETRVGDAERAIVAFRGVLELDSTNGAALRGLERLYAQLGRSAELLSVLEAQAAAATVERERIRLLTRTAEMLEEEFVKLPEASARFEAVLEVDPSNEHAFRGLERLYRRQSRWAELLSTFERHISAAADRGERVALFSSVGQLYLEQLQDLDRAADAFGNALEMDYGHLASLEGLARVHEKRGEWDRAIEALRTQADHERDPARQVEIRYRIGKLSEEKLSDEGQALDLYRSALDANPAHAPSLSAIRQIYQRRGDHYDAAQYLEREVNATDAPRAKAKLFAELGKIWSEQLDEGDRSVAYFEAAIAADPEQDDAAYPLFFHYVRTEQWQAAEPLAESLVRRSSRKDPAEQLQLQFAAGRVAMRLGKLDRAIRCLSTAHGIDRANVEVLSDLALAYFEKRDWENAFKHYHLMVVHHKDELTPEARADLYFRVGVVKREQGDRRRAINFLDKALEEIPAHRPTLEALVETYAQGNEWEQVIGYKRSILDTHLTDPAERYAALLEIGALWQDKAKNPQKAIQSFTEALDLKAEPNANVLLMKLLALYQETKQWSRVIETVTKMSEVEKDGAKKSRYAYTVASIYNTEIKNPDEAVNWYNAALDLNPTDLRAFEKINQILTGKREFKQLERAYRKMIHRVSGKGNRDLEFTLWHSLGLIYRDRLDKKAEAIAAFEAARNLRPDDDQELKILAELYAVVGRSEQAVETWMVMLRREINNPAALKAVYDLHYAARQYDKAWCVASAMCFLLREQAPQDARAFYEQYKPRRPLTPQARLDEQQWVKELFHPDEDVFVGKMFACILPALRRVKVRPVAQFGFTAADQQNPQTSSVALVRAMGLAAMALNLPQMPAIFLKPQQPGGLAYVPSDPWSSVSGANLLQGMQPVELQFLAAKHMSYYRFEHYVRTLFPTTQELTVLMLAAIKFVKPDFDVPPEVMGTVQTLAQQMQQDQVQVAGLQKVVKLFLEQGGQVNIKKWFQSVELTACRAGFLLSGDLEVTKKMLALDPGLPGDVTPTEKLKDVILFSISESYFRLREALGITFQAASA
jgi:tetratricopeptide (TPR) repeat protein